MSGKNFKDTPSVAYLVDVTKDNIIVYNMPRFGLKISKNIGHKYLIGSVLNLKKRRLSLFRYKIFSK